MKNASIEYRRVDFPVLAGLLRLSGSDFLELRRQGYISEERRRNKPLFKLRFRKAGKQCVRYLHADRVAAVREELEKLQADRQLKRQLAALTREASNILRNVKITLKPLLANHGLVFHGLTIRRPRQHKVKSVCSSPNHEITRR